MMNPYRKKLLVLGTGRSGTCWVGSILAQHPEIKGYVEPQPLFSWITQAAIHEADEEALMPKIFGEYERLWREASPQHLSDKSHPAIWIAEKLAAHFSDCSFIGVVRDAAPTIASMLLHPGVRRWCEEWHKYPIPNRFLGITEENIRWYRQASIVERCALRWLAHHRELARLESILGDRFTLVRYEDLVSNAAKVLQSLQSFIGLECQFAAPSPEVDTLTKWRTQLTSEDVKKIQSVIEMDGAFSHR